MTTSRGKWSLFAGALLLAGQATTRAQDHDFLLHPFDKPVATFAEEFDHALGALLINTSAPTHSLFQSETPWMGSNSFVVDDDLRFGTGNVATRSGVPGDFNGNGTAEQADLDLVLLSWGRDGTPPPSGWINNLPGGAINQNELDAALLNWGGGDGGALACLPWEIDSNIDSFYSIQAQAWMPEKSDNPNVTDSIAVAYLDNTDLSQASLEEGRGALWLELYYTDEQPLGAHDAHYRVRAKDADHIVDLYDSADDGQTVDLSSGLATIEVAWKTSSQLAWRMYGAAVMDAAGNVDLISVNPEGMISGPLADFDNQGGFTVGGVGFRMAGSGGMIGGFHAVPEPSTLVLVVVGGWALAGWGWKGRRVGCRK
jgi:hypothetical protein